MLWAACCISFFGFLRSGEMTAPDTGEFDPCQHLTIKDIAVDNQDLPFPSGVSIYLGKTDTPICPVAALLVVRGNGEGPFFMMKGGQHLSRTQLVSHLRKALSAASLNPGDYAGHSFRIGAATTVVSHSRL